jgi:hypothetical protein
MQHDFPAYIIQEHVGKAALLVTLPPLQQQNKNTSIFKNLNRNQQQSELSNGLKGILNGTKDYKDPIVSCL